MEKSNDKKVQGQVKEKQFRCAGTQIDFCLIHGEDSSHMTNECRTMRKQAY
jgi:hypothetical protein